MTEKIRGDAPSLRESLTRRLNPPKGPVRILCDEIGYDFDPRIERTDVLVAFVRLLVAEVEERREFAGHFVRFGGAAPSEGSAEVLALAHGMLSATDEGELIACAKAVHEACWRLNPEDRVPTDHIIDMLSSCASVIQFGLESPCHSRHAAEAASHIWRLTYGVSLLDRHSSAWSKDWACKKLASAVLSLLPAPTIQGNRKDGSSPQSKAQNNE